MISSGGTGVGSAGAMGGEAASESTHSLRTAVVHSSTAPMDSRLIGSCISAWALFSVVSSSTTPTWNDTSINPCANKPNGWQLLYWPKDGQCYRIFQKGYPCPATMELTPGRNGTAECKCPPGTALNSRDAICYKLHQKGPCNENEYFGPVIKQNKSSQGHRWGACFEIEDCEVDKVFWPKDGKCYQKLTKGPCPEGLLLNANGKFGECSCNNNTMPSHFWEKGLSCHEHYSRGPCDPGQIFLPNGICGCNITMKEYYPEDKKCYPIGTQGPCKEGHVYTMKTKQNGNNEEIHGECKCKNGFVLWNQNGKCYQPFTRGPCTHGEMIGVNYTENENNIGCVPVPCPIGKLFFPGGKGCHKVGSQGPCPSGQIVHFQAVSTDIADHFSYLGICGCYKNNDEESSFYPLLRNGTSSCLEYQLGNEPSATKTQETRSLGAFCGSTPGFVLWKDDSCWQLYIQGPCKDGEWLVPDRSKGQREGRGWRVGKCECRPGYTTSIEGNHTTCILNTDIIAKVLGNRF